MREKFSKTKHTAKNNGNSNCNNKRQTKKLHQLVWHDDLLQIILSPTTTQTAITRYVFFIDLGLHSPPTYEDHLFRKLAIGSPPNHLRRCLNVETESKTNCRCSKNSNWTFSEITKSNCQHKKACISDPNDRSNNFWKLFNILVN